MMHIIAAEASFFSVVTTKKTRQGWMDATTGLQFALCGFPFCIGYHIIMHECGMRGMDACIMYFVRSFIVVLMCTLASPLTEMNSMPDVDLNDWLA